MYRPNVVASPKDRFFWAIALREVSFAGGAWALAGGRLAVAGRYMVAITLLFFGVEHFLHPEFVPAVPLNKLMPDWVPIRALWGYLTGAFLVAAGGALLVAKQPRIAVASAGLVVTLLVLLLYLPILLMAMSGPAAAISVAVNFVFDTLLFAGAVLCVARS